MGSGSTARRLRALADIHPDQHEGMAQPPARLVTWVSVSVPPADEKWSPAAPFHCKIPAPLIGQSDRFDDKAIAAIGIARAPALMLVVIIVLFGAPRCIELRERHCIFPEFVCRLQGLPCDDIAIVVQLQTNNQKHQGNPFVAVGESRRISHEQIMEAWALFPRRSNLLPTRRKRAKGLDFDGFLASANQRNEIVPLAAR
jgi:hypothetical protein